MLLLTFLIMYFLTGVLYLLKLYKNFLYDVENKVSLKNILTEKQKSAKMNDIFPPTLFLMAMFWPFVFVGDIIINKINKIYDFTRNIIEKNIRYNTNRFID